MPFWPACATPRKRVFTPSGHGYDSAISRRDAPEFLRKPFAQENRGRRECRVPNAPAASRAIETKHTSVVTTGPPEITRHSPRNGFTAYFVLSPARSGLFVTVISRLLGADLTPASRRQNHTTSPSASAPFVKCAARVHRIPPRVVDVRNAPLWDRTVIDIEVIWVRREAKYFCKRGWAGHFGKHEVICPSGKIIDAVQTKSPCPVNSPELLQERVPYFRPVEFARYSISGRSDGPTMRAQIGRSPSF
jgi:hypothetical protein